MPTPKPKAKNAALRQVALEKAGGFGQQVAQFLFGTTISWNKLRDFRGNNFELGVRHFRAGNVRDAVFRFRLVTWSDPRHAEAWYYLGRSLLAEGRMPEATAALQKSLKLKPKHEEATYLLALAQGKSAPADSLPKRMPVKLAHEHFDALAPDFTREQMEVAQYKGHIELAQAVRAQLMPGRIDHAVLELGVGTGLCGSQLRDIAAQVTGVDISAPMLAEAAKIRDAQGRKAYDALVEKDLHTYLGEAPAASFDIVLASGVAAYIGDLQPLFAGAAKLLKQGGLFALTADRTDSEGYMLDTSAGRFRFSQNYLKGLAAASGLQTVRCDSANVYPDYPAWVCVFKK